MRLHAEEVVDTWMTQPRVQLETLTAPAGCFPAARPDLDSGKASYQALPAYLHKELATAKIVASYEHGMRASGKRTTWSESSFKRHSLLKVTSWQLCLEARAYMSRLQYLPGRHILRSQRDPGTY